MGLRPTLPPTRRQPASAGYGERPRGSAPLAHSGPLWDTRPCPVERARLYRNLVRHDDGDGRDCPGAGWPGGRPRTEAVMNEGLNLAHEDAETLLVMDTSAGRLHSTSPNSSDDCNGQCPVFIA